MTAEIEEGKVDYRVRWRWIHHGTSQYLYLQFPVRVSDNATPEKTATAGVYVRVRRDLRTPSIEGQPLITEISDTARVGSIVYSLRGRDDDRMVCWSKPIMKIRQIRPICWDWKFWFLGWPEVWDDGHHACALLLHHKTRNGRNICEDGSQNRQTDILSRQYSVLAII